MRQDTSCISIATVTMVLILQGSMVYAWPNGAPQDKCGDMTPNHGPEAQTVDSPYMLEFGANAMRYDTDDISITISGDTFNGFLCQMRDDQMNQIGSFNIPANAANLQTVQCPGGEDSGITHSDRLATDSVTFNWSPPSSDMGELTLRCTIVKVKEEFWVGVEAAQTLTHVDAMSGEDTNEDDDSDTASAMHGGALVFLIASAVYAIRGLIAA